MTQEEAREKLLATGHCTEMTVTKYLEAAHYIQQNTWDKFEIEYALAPHRHVPKKTSKTEKDWMDRNHTAKIDFRQQLYLAGVNVYEIDFTTP